MAIFGISCGTHDAAVSVISGQDILFAGHSERYSKKKNDPLLHKGLIQEAMKYGDPDTIIYYERPWLKRTREWYSGQTNRFNHKQHIRQFFGKSPTGTVGHHEAHAAAGYYTSGFDDAAVIVIDAIGEWDTTSVWVGSGDVLKKVWSARYPNSIGLLYSAFTQRCGFKPNEEEYIMMGASAFGHPNVWYDSIMSDFIEYGIGPEFKLRQNVHRGIGNWKPEATVEDLAAAMQEVLEDYLIQLFEWVAFTTGKKHLVFMGGVALNCVANGKLSTRNTFDKMWIMPNPGDAGASLGAALAYQGKHVRWDSPYLGTDIKQAVDIEGAVAALKSGQVIALANGRSEFGPRALGNRSILVDPRTRNAKSRVNKIKERQNFRPFGTSVLEEHARDWFIIPDQIKSSPYMQYTWRVKYPRLVPAICHVDATSRIQTVNRQQNSVFYDLLTRWFEETECPMLLNTSLNIKGMPLVNDWYDAEMFGTTYNIPIF